MVKGDVIFCATGVTDGDMVKGIKTIKVSSSKLIHLLHKNQKISKKIKIF